MALSPPYAQTCASYKRGAIWGFHSKALFCSPVKKFDKVDSSHFLEFHYFIYFLFAASRRMFTRKTVAVRITETFLSFSTRRSNSSKASESDQMAEKSFSPVFLSRAGFVPWCESERYTDFVVWEFYFISRLDFRSSYNLEFQTFFYIRRLTRERW